MYVYLFVETSLINKRDKRRELNDLQLTQTHQTALQHGSDLALTGVPIAP